MCDVYGSRRSRRRELPGKVVSAPPGRKGKRVTLKKGVVLRITEARLQRLNTRMKQYVVPLAGFRTFAESSP